MHFFARECGCVMIRFYSDAKIKRTCYLFTFYRKQGEITMGEYR